jgi:hypothetical protein
LKPFRTFNALFIQQKERRNSQKNNANLHNKSAMFLVRSQHQGELTSSLFKPKKGQKKITMGRKQRKKTSTITVMLSTSLSSIISLSSSLYRRRSAPAFLNFVHAEMCVPHTQTPRTPKQSLAFCKDDREKDV